ncbi:MAG: hypothetical protein AAGC81_17705 [Pseudomonadota bacterium]
MTLIESVPNRAINLSLTGLFAFVAYLQLELYPAGMHEDDVFFYFQIARNAIENGSLSFDGSTTTNGFHLLWMAVLVTGGMVFSQAIAIETALLATSAIPLIIFAWICRPITFVQILTAAYFVGFGMEGLLGALLFIALARSIDHGNSALCASIGFLIVMTRVDYSLPLCLIAFWMLWHNSRLSVRILGSIAAGLTVTALGNWLIAGDLLSVSSRLTAAEAAEFDMAQLARINFYSLGNMIRLCIWAGAIGTILYAWDPTRETRRELVLQPLFHATLASFLLVHGLGGFLRDWYFAMPVLVAIYGAGKATSGYLRPAIPALALGVLLPASAAATKFYRDFDTAQAYRSFVEDLRSTTTGPLFVYDGSGYIAWHLHPHPVINGDGLVNSRSFALNQFDPAWMQAYLRDHQVRQFLSDFNRDHCLNSVVCCEEGSLQKIAQFDGSRTGLSDRLYAFAEGKSCELAE